MTDARGRKKDGVDLFDVPMGSFHGAEICDVVGLYLLDKLSTVFGEKECGLYRDDGLAIIDWATPRQLDCLRKKAISVARSAGFKLTIDIGHTKTDFLDISIDLANNVYRPYRKKNAKTRYINKKSNHPIHIKTELPVMFEKRLITLSKDKEAFDSTKAEYNQALTKSGYKHELSYKTEQPKKKTRNKRRKCIFYYPPYFRSTKTNVGRFFLQLFGKHFGVNHPLRRAFNRNAIKLSFSSKPKVKPIIQSHNKNVIEKTATIPEKACICNCRKDACPLPT